ncbi:hypothetical protein L7F22_025602 [Adiantum nelumboides]|nr:hypothetical protein [Adiantum nelumboides]
MSSPPSHILHSPSQGTLYEQASVWTDTLKTHLQVKVEELRSALYSSWVALWSNQRPTFVPIALPSTATTHPEISTKLTHSLERQCEELKKELKAKREEFDKMREAWGKEVKALKMKMEHLIEKDRESNDNMRAQAHHLLEDLHQRLVEIEHTRTAHLAQMQKEISEHRMAMSNLHKEAEASLAKVSQAISTLT